MLGVIADIRVGKTAYWKVGKEDGEKKKKCVCVGKCQLKKMNLVEVTSQTLGVRSENSQLVAPDWSSSAETCFSHRHSHLGAATVITE